MNYYEEVRNSAMVRNPVDNIGIVQNTKGRYWANIGNFIIGLHDVRPRLGTFTNPWGAVSNPIFAAPKLEFVGLSLKDMMNERACELLELSTRENRPIAVMWSGGIDSTGVLSALIRNSTNLEQIHVYCNMKSVFENPGFFGNCISDKVKCLNIRELDVTEKFIDNNILVHGDPGDCLLGPSMPMYQHLIADGLHRESWRDRRQDIIKGIENGKSMPGFAEWYVNKISDNIDEVGYEINSVSEWWWWHYFNLKWEFSLLRPFFETRHDPYNTTIGTEHLKKHADTVFFNTAKFQSWSYTNLERLCTSQKEHKSEMKKYIFELDRNEFYMKNKTKTVSVAGYGVRPIMLNKDLYAYSPSDPNISTVLLDLLEQYTG